MSNAATPIQNGYQYDPQALLDARAAGIVDVFGRACMQNAKGGHDPVETIKPQNRLQDELVRQLFFFAEPLSEQISRFKEHCFADISDFEALLAQEYNATIGGKKGNKTLMTNDALMKVSVQVADQITFGPELQIAKSLVDECLIDWSSSAGPELRAITNLAFDVDKEGTINRTALFTLLRYEIEDPRWQQAMRALRDAIRVVGSKLYMRFYKRSSQDAPWQAVSLDMARA
ncbi:MAG: DUF3164 family protein [Rhizobiales bacterium]|nr:DUF3164 family protein [Hyphomicrobiales bacterium]